MKKTSPLCFAPSVAAYPTVTHPLDQTVSAGQSVTITWIVGGDPQPFWSISGPGVNIGPRVGEVASCQSSSSIQPGDTYTYTISVSDVTYTIHDYVNIICPANPGLAWYSIFGVIAAFGIIVIFKFHKKVRKIN